MYPQWTRRLSALAVLAVTFIGGGAHAQRPTDMPSMNARPNTPINAAKDIRFEQKMDAQVPLDVPFVNEDGKTVSLKTYAGKKPIVLVMPFYKCPGICSQELMGMVDVFRDPELKFKLGRDFEVVTISIDPTETPALAGAKKREHLDLLNQPGADAGWHFLTGQDANIRKVANSFGYKYAFDPQTKQYAHPGGIVVLTPQGKVSRYFFGVGYAARDVKLGLTEAGQGRIGSVADQFILACYHYDPKTGTYGPKVFLIMQVLGFSTIGILGTFMFFALRKDFREPKLIRTSDGRLLDERTGAVVSETGAVAVNATAAPSVEGTPSER